MANARSLADEHLRQKLITMYAEELRIAERMQLRGVTQVNACMAGKDLARGRAAVPIDEYVEMWSEGLACLKAGADPHKFNY